MTGPRVLHARGLFKTLHDQLTGAGVDFAAFDVTAYPAERVALAVRVWNERVQTEFRSIQIMNRFTAEVLGSADPLEVYAGAADLVIDEIRHTALCVGMVEALGGQPTLPDPVHEEEARGFLDLPMPERALTTAITMLGINETLSTGYIADLHARCTDPVVHAILSRTLADEDQHHAFGWRYVEASLARFDTDSVDLWRDVAVQGLAEHLEDAERVLATIPTGRRTLEAWPEPELAALGLMSQERQALVFRRTYEQALDPKLRALGLR